jgi:hypothetical protein
VKWSSKARIRYEHLCCTTSDVASIHVCWYMSTVCNIMWSRRVIRWYAGSRLLKKLEAGPLAT